jgi:hypothetical protein
VRLFVCDFFYLLDLQEEWYGGALTQVDDDLDRSQPLGTTARELKSNTVDLHDVRSHEPLVMGELYVTAIETTELCFDTCESLWQVSLMRAAP